MPRCDGVTAARRILEDGLKRRVIVLTTYADDNSVLAALEAGVRGYLTKDATAAEIQRDIRTVMPGGAPLDPCVQRRLLERVIGRPSAVTTPSGAASTLSGAALRASAAAATGSAAALTASAAAATGSAAAATGSAAAATPWAAASTGSAAAATPSAVLPDGLTQREVEVLREIAAGYSNREIAERLVIGEATVRTCATISFEG